MNYSISVVAPFFNEEGNLAVFLTRTHRALEALALDYEIVLVDDGSEDGSLAVVEAFRGAELESRIVVVRHERNRGIFPSWQSGLAASTKQLVVLIDSDLQNPPEAIARLYAAFQASTCHVVQGTRSTLEFNAPGRLVASRALNAALNLVFGGKATDHKSGFILGPREVLKSSLTLKTKVRFGQTFVRALIEARGLVVKEVETIFFPRQAGNSFLAGRHLATALTVLAEIPRVARELRRSGRQGILHHVALEVAALPRTRTRLTISQRLWRLLFFATVPLHTWNISIQAGKLLKVLESSDWFPEDLRARVQQKRLLALLWSAFGRVPHYRRIFVGLGQLPDDLDPHEVLKRLPLLSKADVRDALYFDLFAVGNRLTGLHRIATSGSTGSPFITYVDRDQLTVRFATTLRAQQMTGWRFGDRQMRLWHQNIGLSVGQQVRERLNAVVSRRVFVPAFELNASKVETLVTKIERWKPVLIDGYAESFNYLSQALGSRKLDHAPRAVMTSAQILTESTRTEIESRMRARVFDKYGSREFSGIAYECSESNGHHVQWESYIVEILKDGQPVQPGEVGEVVITDLNNLSVPLIRYRLGDLAVAIPDGPCGCGRSAPKIGSIVGRTQALVLVDDDVWLPGTFFAHFFKDYESVVRQFQVVQREPGSFVLNVVKGDHWDVPSWERVLEDLRAFTGDDVGIDVRYVDSIPLGRTGKRTPVVSELSFDFQETSLRVAHS